MAMCQQNHLAHTVMLVPRYLHNDGRVVLFWFGFFNALNTLLSFHKISAISILFLENMDK